MDGVYVEVYVGCIGDDHDLVEQFKIVLDTKNIDRWSCSYFRCVDKGVGDGQVVDKGCVYVDAFGVYGRTV